MSENRRESLKKDMRKSFVEENYHLSLSMNMKFDRHYPPGANAKATLN
jgi:hypothetical protein